jgi:hypothetical protein
MSNEVRVTDPVTGGQKGMKPERFALIPWDSLAELARVYGFGANKYEDHNWAKGYKWSLSSDALGRHFSAFMQGEDRDAESGCLHLAHAAWHCLTLIAFKLRGLGTDDRLKTVSDKTPGPWQPTLGQRVRIRPDPGLFESGEEGTVVSIKDDVTFKIEFEEGRWGWFDRKYLEKPAGAP